MSNDLYLALALIAGAALGALFFGGLRWTVRRGVCSSHPALWFLASLLLRTAITLAGFYLVARGRWERLLICLLGFVIARAVVIRQTRIPAEKTARMTKEVRHAP